MNAGKPPSNAILKMGPRPPIQRWHSHSEVRNNKPIARPKIRMPMSLPVSPNMPHPRSRSGQSKGIESNCRLRHTSRREGICAKLRVLVSSRHNGPAFSAVSTSSTAEKVVPISVATVSILNFGIRFNGMRLEIERRNCRRSIINFDVCRRRGYTNGDCCVTQSTRRLRARLVRTDRASHHTREALSGVHWPEPSGTQTVIFIADSTRKVTGFQVTLKLLIICR